jgi:hypothetical protein
MMPCESFDLLAADLARGAELAPALRETGLSHARECLRCAARLDDERAVTAALAALASRTVAAEAPARVEWSLRRALRESKTRVEGGSGRRAGLFHAVEAALLASAAVLAVVAVVPRGTPPRAEPVRVASPVAAPASPAAARGEEADFVSLSYGEDLRDLDSLQVVQVELPRTSLAAFGWPAGDPQGGSVTAELIVGHDGVARAIRVLE